MPSEPAICLIWAQSRGGVIGADGTLPWRLPEDLVLFRAVTTGGVVLMGRRTWDSLPAAVRPLPGRRNLVLTRRPEWDAAGAERADPSELPAAQAIWVIGGEQVFAELEPRARVALRTTVDVDVTGDAHAPRLGPGWGAPVREPWSGPRASSAGPGYAVDLLVRGPAPDGAWFGQLVATLTRHLPPVDHSPEPHDDAPYVILEGPVTPATPEQV